MTSNSGAILPAEFSSGGGSSGVLIEMRVETVELDFHVNELAADQAGSLSPFGQDLEFPLPLNTIRYSHPGKAERPHLADWR